MSLEKLNSGGYLETQDCCRLLGMKALFEAREFGESGTRRFCLCDFFTHILSYYSSREFSIFTLMLQVV
jgi:hypothetical protein